MLNTPVFMSIFCWQSLDRVTDNTPEKMIPHLQELQRK